MTISKRLLDGTSATSFRIGTSGPTIFQGQSAPSSALGQSGDLYVRWGTTSDWFAKTTSGWISIFVDLRLASRLQTIMRGIPTQLDGSTEYIAVAPDTATADSSLILADDMTISADAEPQAVTRIVLPISPAEGQILTLKDELSPAGTYPIEIIGSMDGVGEKDIVITGGTLQIVFSGGEWRLI